MAITLTNIHTFFAGGFDRIHWWIPAAGYFAGTTGTIGVGLDVGMGKLQGAFSASVPSPAARRIRPEGDDGVLGEIALPPAELLSFELQMHASDMLFAKTVQGTKIFSLGYWDLVDVDPDSPTFQNMGLILTRKASSLATAETGAGFEHMIIPLCQVTFGGPGEFRTGENEATYTYSVTLQKAGQYPWGTAYTAANEGTTLSDAKMLFTQNRWGLHGFTGNGSLTNFTLDFTPASETLQQGIEVFKDGVRESAGVTIVAATKTVTYAVAPTSGAKVVVAYEYLLT